MPTNLNISVTEAEIAEIVNANSTLLQLEGDDPSLTNMANNAVSICNTFESVSDDSNTNSTLHDELVETVYEVLKKLKDSKINCRNN